MKSLDRNVKKLFVTFGNGFEWGNAMKREDVPLGLGRAGWTGGKMATVVAAKR